MSLQKATEDEFIRLQQGSISVLEYTLKFMELPRFTPAHMADEKLRMNHFKAGLNTSLKERMSVRHHTSYEDMYQIAISVQRAMKERNEFYSEQRGVKCGVD